MNRYDPLAVFKNLKRINLINIFDTDNFIVDYDKENKRYRVTYFDDYHFVDEVWFDEYKCE